MLLRGHRRPDRASTSRGALLPSSACSTRSCSSAGFANIVLGVFNLHPLPARSTGPPCSSGSCPARLLPGYYNLQPFLMFLPFILILLFRNQWSELITHIISWWAGLLV